MFTSGGLVEAALEVLEPLYAGENALEPERVSEKLHQNTFWMGRGGTLTHTISGIDIALWDIVGKALGQPVARLLGGVYRHRAMPYCSILMEEPGPMRDAAQQARDAGFRALKIGWGPFGRRDDPKLDEAIVRSARDGFGEGRLFVDAGASDAYWPQQLKWAIRTSHMLAAYDVGWFEEALRPDALDDFVELRRLKGLGKETVDVSASANEFDDFGIWHSRSELQVRRYANRCVPAMPNIADAEFLSRPCDAALLAHSPDLGRVGLHDVERAARQPRRKRLASGQHLTAGDRNGTLAQAVTAVMLERTTPALAA